MKVYKIVEVVEGDIKTLFYGINKSRIMPKNKWIKADVKIGRDGSGNRYYKTGWHTLPSVKEAKDYLKNFKSRLNILKIVECEIKGDIWKKEHSPSNVFLSEYIKFKKII